MVEAVREVLSGKEAWIVGGAVRDQLLGRPLVDLDVACREPEEAARAFARRIGGAPFPLSERHGAWRVVLEAGETVDFTPLPGSIEEDLGTRDFTINAIAMPLAGGEPADPFEGRPDLEQRIVRAVSAHVFENDPLRLLRAVRLEDELGFRLEPRTERLVHEQAALVTRPPGERILGELLRLSTAGWRRLAELGLLERLGGSLERADKAAAVDTPEFRLVAFLGDTIGTLPISRELRRYAIRLLRSTPPTDGSARAIHRFRRQTEPWALDALALHGASDYAGAVEQARAAEPEEPLLHGDELGLPPGPAIGQALERIAEERAVGTISTREEALELVRREFRFPNTASKLAALEESRREVLREELRVFVAPAGDERALDAGTGTGALAFALAPLVREVVAVDPVPELLAEGRRRAAEFPNVRFVQGDATKLEFEAGEFDLAATLRTLHHVARPELVIAELTRVTRPGGRVLVVDQIGPADPLAALELTRFERARDPSTSRILADVDLRGLFEANSLVLLASREVREPRDLDAYLDLAGCEGEAREQARALAPPGYTATLGWYLLRKPSV
jgi:ubiquinone/menaquinone biosynthesis C-methylase UbiE